MTPEVQPTTGAASDLKPVAPAAPVATNLGQAAVPTILLEVAPLTLADLPAGKKTMLTMLSKTDNGAVLVQQAQQLAATVTVKDQTALLTNGQEARDALSAISSEMIGERRLGAAGPIGELFTSLGNFEKELKIGEITAKKTGFTSFLTSLPGGTRFEPVIKFVERYKKIKPVIDEKEKNIQTLEVERVTNKGQLSALQVTVFKNFRQLEVAIAAGEIALEREVLSFEADRTRLTGTEDVVALQELRNRRLGITNLDNRLMKLQGTRLDAMLDLPLIDKAINNEEQLRATLEDLQTVTIPQIKKSVAIALKIYDEREAAALAGGVQELNAALREANIAALGMAQEETHKVAIQGAKEVDNIVLCMGKFATVLARGNQLLAENTKINAEARDKLVNAEGKFRKDLEATLRDVPKAA